MTDIFSTLSHELADAVAAADASVVQLHGRRQTAGVVFDTDLVLAPASATSHDTVAVRTGDGRTFEGTVLGHTASGLGVVRVNGLGAPAVRPADEPRVGSLALAVGRTWSGNVFSLLAPVAVVGGPLRTGRRSEIARVIRLGLAPHNALVGGALVGPGGAFLGLVTGAAIRGTTVVIPASIAIAEARALAARGAERHGFIGVTSLPVALAPAQRLDGRERGVLVTGVSPEGPAGSAGILVGDVIVAFEGTTVPDHEALLRCLSGDRIGQPVTLAVVRGNAVHSVAVTVGEWPGV